MFDRFNTLFGRAYLALTDRTYSLRRQEGQTMAEYALILGIILVTTITIIGTMGTKIHDKLQSICTALGGADASCP
jgi:Flp pilus assembly pilin Flp